jgi:Lon protease-like protein
MPERLSRGFPLFPLGIVALPSETVPLHIFEDRYRQMMEECLQGEREFGILWLSEEELKPIGCACQIEQVIERMPDGRLNILARGTRPFRLPIGCACQIEQVIERMPDGRLNILARGTRPFRLVARQDDLPYPAGVVEFLAEQEEVTDPDNARAAHELYRELVEQATDRTPAEDELLQMNAYRMAATVEFGADAKQELLELRSENARLRLLALLLRAAIKRLELVDRAQARARSNGKVRFA